MRSPRYNGLLLLLFVATLFTACQKELPPVEDSLVYIPEDAAMVTAIRLQQLMDKADFESLKETEGFQSMLQDAAEENAMLAKVLADPTASGIDLSKNMYVSVELSDSEPLMTVASFSIAEPEALEQMMEGLNVEAKPVSNDFKYSDTPGKASVAWNNEVLLLGMADGSIGVKDRLLRYLENPAAGSVADNSHLREQLQGDFDILNWLSSDFILRSRDWQASGNLLNYDKEDLSGQHLAHALTFGKGVIENQVMLTSPASSRTTSACFSATKSPPILSPPRRLAPPPSCSPPPSTSTASTNCWWKNTAKAWLKKHSTSLAFRQKSC